MSTFQAAQNRSKIVQKSSKTALGPKTFFACGAPKEETDSLRSSTETPPRASTPVTSQEAVDTPAGAAAVVQGVTIYGRFMRPRPRREYGE